MKRSFFIIALIALFSIAVCAHADESWVKVADNLYIDESSVEIRGDYITGYFKETNVNKEIVGKQVSYTKIWEGAFCDIELQGGIKKIEYPIYWYYSKDDDLLDEVNIHKYWMETYPDGHLGVTHPEEIDNGDVYFSSLCKYFR